MTCVIGTHPLSFVKKSRVNAFPLRVDPASASVASL